MPDARQMPSVRIGRGGQVKSCGMKTELGGELRMPPQTSTRSGRSEAYTTQVSATNPNDEEQRALEASMKVFLEAVLPIHVIPRAILLVGTENRLGWKPRRGKRAGI